MSKESEPDSPGLAEVPQWEIWYFSAFQALPRIFLDNPQHFWSNIAKHEGRRALWLMTLLRVSRAVPKLEEDETAVLEFHDGTLDDGTEYVIFEYPTPPLVKLTEEQLAAQPLLTPAENQSYLGAYFSAILLPHGDRPAACFALSQSPAANVTTLRRCTEGAHYNLGPGPSPTLEEFIAILPEAFDREPRGRTVIAPEKLGEIDRSLSVDLKSPSPELLRALFGPQPAAWYRRLTLPVSIILGCLIGAAMFAIFHALGQVKPEDSLLTSLLLAPVWGFFWLRYLADEVHEGRSGLLSAVTAALIALMTFWSLREHKFPPAAGVAYAVFFSPIVSGELASFWRRFRANKAASSEGER